MDTYAFQGTPELETRWKSWFRSIAVGNGVLCLLPASFLSSGHLYFFFLGIPVYSCQAQARHVRIVRLVPCTGASDMWASKLKKRKVWAMAKWSQWSQPTRNRKVRERIHAEFLVLNTAQESDRDRVGSRVFRPKAKGSALTRRYFSTLVFSTKIVLLLCRSCGLALRVRLWFRNSLCMCVR